MQDNTRFRNKITVAVVVIVLLIAYQVGLSISRIGETKVSIIVIPNGSKLTVNGKPVSSKTLYLKPGNYSIAASEEGWTTDTQQVDVAKTKTNVSLIPAPASQAAQDFLNNNPDLENRRQNIASNRANSAGKQTTDKNPLISLLPYTSVSGPFIIDYGPSATRKNGVFYVISGSTPDGRQNALKWIKEHGQDPTNLEIQYSDFANPLAGGAGTPAQAEVGGE